MRLTAHACVQEVNEADDGDCSFGSRLWDASPEGAAQTAVRNIVESYCRSKPRRARDTVDKRPWERVMDDAVERLNADFTSDSKFHRPPAKTDRLFAVLERGEAPVLVKHPAPAPGYEHSYRDNLPNIRCGAIASGRVVARNAAWRTQVKQPAARFRQIIILTLFLSYQSVNQSTNHTPAVPLDRTYWRL